MFSLETVNPKLVESDLIKQFKYFKYNVNK